MTALAGRTRNTLKPEIIVLEAGVSSDSLEGYTQVLSPITRFLRAEYPFVLAACVLALLVSGGGAIAEVSTLLPRAALFAGIFAVVLIAAIGVMHHAEHLAAQFGDPLGTIVLTLSAIAIEISLIATISLQGESNPTLARDTMFAILMITLNGLIGLSLLTGAIRHRIQGFNAEGAQSFLAILVPLAVIALILPNFTLAAPGGRLSTAQAAVFALFSLMLYAIFLWVQTRRHQSYFQSPEELQAHEKEGVMPSAEGGRGRLYHLVMLGLTLLPIPLISESLAVLIEGSFVDLGLPEALAGVVIAMLVLSPEGISGVRAAVANRMQRSINILFGTALSTIALTVPAVVLLGLFTGHELILGLAAEDSILLALTLALCMLTFGGRSTDLLKGAVHLVLFGVFLLLVIVP
ncbi:calcium:proton antiporter [Fodinicurvata halophila]|uniref:Calcium:proton antiporter n=2 Tax=Fodinicurvata halophila TaxID=1419723 RepID=A0ABV8UHW7_9PROT